MEWSGFLAKRTFFVLLLAAVPCMPDSVNPGAAVVRDWRTEEAAGDETWLVFGGNSTGGATLFDGTVGISEPCRVSEKRKVKLKYWRNILVFTC